MPRKRHAPQSPHPAITWQAGRWWVHLLYTRGGVRRLYIGHFRPDELDKAIAAVTSRQGLAP